MRERTERLPAKIRITATEGRGVSSIPLSIDERHSARAGLALLSRVSKSIATLDRATRGHADDVQQQEAAADGR